MYEFLMQYGVSIPEKKKITGVNWVSDSKSKFTEDDMLLI